MAYDSSSHDSSGFTAGFFMGLLVGGAGGYLLSSDKGKAILDNLKENAGEKLAELADNPVIADKLADLEATMREARATLETGTDTARERLHETAEKVAEATAPEKPKKRTFFRRGTPLK
jgi:hypothetical protein